MAGPPHLPDPSAWQVVIDSLYGMCLAIAGGIVTMLQKLAAESYKSKWGILADFAASGFAGIMVFTLCRAFNVEFYLQAFLTGMAGHAGVQALEYMKKRIVEKADRL